MIDNKRQLICLDVLINRIQKLVIIREDSKNHNFSFEEIMALDTAIHFLKLLAVAALKDEVKL